VDKLILVWNLPLIMLSYFIYGEKAPSALERLIDLLNDKSRNCIKCKSCKHKELITVECRMPDCTDFENYKAKK